MGRENKSTRPTIIKALAALHARPVENMVAEPGMPDIACIGHWIECKQEPKWPARGYPLLEHYTPQQRLWHLTHCRRGGNCWVMYHAGREWILLWGTDAAHHLGRGAQQERYDRDQLIQLAYLHFPRQFDGAELLTFMKNWMANHPYGWNL